MINDILGDRMLKTNSVETVMKYTMACEGVSVVNFDELPHTDNFKGLQDLMKGHLHVVICIQLNILK